MTETVGKRLQKARQARGLSLEEVAHTTRMRPDKILALENDDYSRFGNHVYAKGFLLIYSRLLKVDASEEIRFLETPTGIHLSDYQYLNNAAEPAPKRSSRFPFRPTNKPSVLPLVLVAIVLIGGGFGVYIMQTARRLDPAPSLAEQPPVIAQPAPEPSAPEPAPAAEPEPAAPTAPLAPAVAATEPAPQDPENASPEVRRAEPVARPAEPPLAEAPSTPAVPSPSALPPAAPTEELTVSARKKTWVKISKGEAKNRPFFSDYLYPSAPPLKLKPGRYFITPRDPSAIEVRKNGEPVSYEPGAAIQ
jgi:cytoskeletal protein RodZ